jgi:hypothetical protein
MAFLVVKIFIGNSANDTTRREEESTYAEEFKSILDIYTRFGGEFTLEDTEILLLPLCGFEILNSFHSSDDPIS